jgi:hypothetical protein
VSTAVLAAPKKVSQKSQIREHLNRINPATGLTRGISALEAIGLYRIYRLAARIDELREDGMDIITVMKTDETGKQYARYFLASD